MLDARNHRYQPLRALIGALYLLRTTKKALTDGLTFAVYSGRVRSVTHAPARGRERGGRVAAGC
jgi:hypothetical protein